MQKTIEKLVREIAATKTETQTATVNNEKNDAVIQLRGFKDHTAARKFATNLVDVLRKEKWRVTNEKHTLGNPDAKEIKNKTDLSQYELAHAEKGEIHIAFAGHPTQGYLTRITLKNTQITK